MEKKAEFSTIVGFTILLVFLGVVLFYFFGEGILTKVANSGENLADNALKGLKKDIINKGALVADKDVNASYIKILKALESTGNGPCLLEFGSLTEDFKDYTISLSKSEKDIFSQLINEKGQILSTKTIKNKILCVVGGNNSAKNFYQNYLIEENCINNKNIECKSKDYTAVNELVLKENNKIVVDGIAMPMELGDSVLVDSPGNLLFRSADGNICFFPTFDGDPIGTCNSDETGLDDDCIDDMAKEITDIKICK